MSKLITYEDIKEIKKLTIIALCSDNYLMDKLILKGGTCIELAFNISSRASKDIDFSIEYLFDDETLRTITETIQSCFDKIFIPKEYYPFDIKFDDSPPEADDTNVMSGYILTFKLTTKDNFEKYKSNLELLRKTALSIGKNNTKSFRVEISKHEFCKDSLKELKEIDGHKVYVYSPALVVFEKMRAICQSMKEYRERQKTKTDDKPRSRDFYDIELVNENLANIDFKDANNREILKQVFKAKNVDLSLLLKIKDKYSIHLNDFNTVLKTEGLKRGVVDNFTYYFDYVLAKVEELEEFWIK